ATLGVLCTRSVGFGDAWSQVGEVGEVPVDQRKVVDEPAIHDLAGGGVFGLQVNGFRVDFDGLRGRADFQGEVDRNVLTDIQGDARLLFSLKAFGFDTNFVGPGRDGANEVSAGRIGGGGEGVALVLVDEGDLRSGHESAGGVGDDAGYAAAIEL